MQPRLHNDRREDRTGQTVRRSLVAKVEGLFQTCHRRMGRRRDNRAEDLFNHGPELPDGSFKMTVRFNLHKVGETYRSFRRRRSWRPVACFVCSRDSS